MINKGWVLAAASMVLLLGACKDTAPNYDPLPYVYVYEQVFLNEIRAQPLNTRDGAYIYISGGLKGIILYRRAQSDFIALERQSPATPGCAAKVDVTMQYVQDSCSNSTFDFAGRLLSGTSSANLRQYVVNFDGNRILITN